MGSKQPHGDKPTRAPDGAAPIAGEAPRRARCPVCTAPSEAAFRPFCSRRCADVDLSRWLRGSYAIPGNAEVDEDGDDSAAASSTPRQVAHEEDDDDTPV